MVLKAWQNLANRYAQDPNAIIMKRLESGACQQFCFIFMCSTERLFEMCIFVHGNSTERWSETHMQRPIQMVNVSTLTWFAMCIEFVGKHWEIIRLAPALFYLVRSSFIYVCYVHLPYIVIWFVYEPLILRAVDCVCWLQAPSKSWIDCIPPSTVVVVIDELCVFKSYENIQAPHSQIYKGIATVWVGAVANATVIMYIQIAYGDWKQQQQQQQQRQTRMTGANIKRYVNRLQLQCPSATLPLPIPNKWSSLPDSKWVALNKFHEIMALIMILNIYLFTFLSHSPSVVSHAFSFLFLFTGNNCCCMCVFATDEEAKHIY